MSVQDKFMNSQKDIIFQNKNALLKSIMAGTVSVKLNGHSALSIKLFKKTERLFYAIFYISNKIPEKDIKDILENKITNILFLTASLNSVSLKDINKIIGDILIIKTMINTLILLGKVSTSNMLLIRGAFDHFLSFLNDSIDNNSYDSDNSSELQTIFSDEFMVELPKKMTAANQNLIEKSDSLQNQNSFSDNPGNGNDAQKKQNDFHSEKTDKKEVSKSSKSTLKNKAKSNNRRVLILDLLSRKGEISISDVKDILQDLSQKTIQRELNKMVSENILQKHGNKRWTTYTIR